MAFHDVPSSYKKAFHKRLEQYPVLRRFRRHWLTVAFFLGFLVDTITLNRVDQIFDNIVLASYVLLGGTSMWFLYASAAEKLPASIQTYAKQWSPLVLQFAFGGLLSGILIFYSRSGSLFVSWPFLLVIIVVIAGNELLKRRTQRLIFNLSVFFVGLFSYMVLIVPVALGKMGALVFVLSGFAALVLMYGFVKLLYRIIPNFLSANLRFVIFSLGMIYFSLNALYFTNVIPPIPLSLKDIGIYHNVERLDNGDYEVTYEKGAWYEPFKDADDTYHYESGDTVYCFTSVFAPTRLATTIYHRWEYYDRALGEWRFHDRLAYEIRGGRDGGFRGYTSIKNVRDGTWRCTVETERKQVLGRDKFKIESRAHDELITETR